MNYFIFTQFTNIIKREFGINYSLKKKLVLKNRIDARLRELNLNSYYDYLELLNTGDKKELQSFADKVTTNTTYFFREPQHFKFLREEVFPQFKDKEYSPIRIWSAPCSSGQESYSIAIEGEEFKQKNPKFNYKIYGSDINSSVIEQSKFGSYTLEDVATIPPKIRSKYFQTIEEQFKIEVSIRKKCIFYQLNFLKDDIKKQTKFDVIFCRNLLMYFQKSEQELIMQKLCDRLVEGGHLIISRNESINGLDLPLELVEHSIFRKKKSVQKSIFSTNVHKKAV